MLMVDDFPKGAGIEMGVFEFVVVHAAVNQCKSSNDGTQICRFRIP